MSSMEPDEGSQADAPRLDKLQAADAPRLDAAERTDAPRLDAADDDADDSDGGTDS